MTLVIKMKLENIFSDYKKTWCLMQPYRSASKIIQTKLESIDDELKCTYGYSPIHMIQSRIKSTDSILEKLQRKGHSTDEENLSYLNDIAGLRVVCNYINDIQYISQLLIMHKDIELVRNTNYIDYPKESGYRSLHLVVKVPVRLQTGVVDVPVEIQMRTIAMDFWASLEHELLYKNHGEVNDEIRKKLKDCAEQMAQTDLQMQRISQELRK